LKILMTGGGTGGHLYPALAVAEALKRLHNEAEILFIGSNRGLESREVPEAGYAFRGLDTTGFPRRPGLRSIAAAVSFFTSILKARTILREFRPQVIFSTGGYASAPVVVAARLERVPLVLHEQNSIPGMTNRVACRFAAEVHLAFPSARKFFAKRGHLRLSGNPLREQVTAGSRTRALRLFRLDEDRRTVLVFGGSQGAHSINEALSAALPAFQEKQNVQFLIQSGTSDYEMVLARCREVRVQTWVRRFISNMGDAYALADLVVCRAGAMTISELAACGLPAILIPYPHAAANHQMLNAEQMKGAGAAVILTDSELNGPSLAREIDALLSNPRRLREMSINALRLARLDAATKIARALLKFRPAAELPPEPDPSRLRAAQRERGEAPKRVGLSRSAPSGQDGARGRRRGPSGGSARGTGGAEGNGGSSWGGAGAAPGGSGSAGSVSGRNRGRNGAGRRGQEPTRLESTRRGTHVSEMNGGDER
jgi:UDP-N-acetylglucosamine--N-acetylmuramyl-(pentapeptide) pyrophosphoryl-undecaprenol N-acetylglucosamine transferase